MAERFKSSLVTNRLAHFGNYIVVITALVGFTFYLPFVYWFEILTYLALISNNKTIFSILCIVSFLIDVMQGNWFGEQITLLLTITAIFTGYQKFYKVGQFKTHWIIFALLLITTIVTCTLIISQHDMLDLKDFNLYILVKITLTIFIFPVIHLFYHTYLLQWVQPRL